jgi:hypothetical protein
VHALSSRGHEWILIVECNELNRWLVRDVFASTDYGPGVSIRRSPEGQQPEVDYETMEETAEAEIPPARGFRPALILKAADVCLDRRVASSLRDLAGAVDPGAPGHSHLSERAISALPVLFLCSSWASITYMIWPQQESAVGSARKVLEPNR